MPLFYRVRGLIEALSERTSLSLFTASVICAVLLVTPENQLNDGDTLWHIVLGRKILENWRLPHEDTFSYTFHGDRYETNSWLSDVLLGAAYNFDGFAGVVALSTLCMALTFFLLQREYLRTLSNTSAIFFCCAAFLLLTPHILSRPHVLVFPLVAVWAIVLLRAEEENRVPPLWSLLIFFLWVNMHGSFLLGFVVTIPICLWGVFRDGRFDREKMRSWGLFLIGMAAMTMMGPYGVNPLRTAFSVISIGPLLSSISEWKPEDFSSFGAFEAVLLATIGAVTFGGVKLSLARAAILLGLLHMALSHTRNSDYLAIFGSVLLAPPLALSQSTKNLPLNTSRLLPIGLAIAIAALGALHIRTVAPRDRAYPINAIKAAHEAGVQGNVLNGYGFGGALIFDGVKVFIDSRAEFYPRSFLEDYIRLINRPDVERVSALLTSNDIQWTFLERSNAVTAIMEKLPDWREVYRDDAAVVHVRGKRAP